MQTKIKEYRVPLPATGSNICMPLSIVPHWCPHSYSSWTADADSDKLICLSHAIRCDWIGCWCNLTMIYMPKGNIQLLKSFHEKYFYEIKIISTIDWLGLVTCKKAPCHSGIVLTQHPFLSTCVSPSFFTYWCKTIWKTKTNPDNILIFWFQILSDFGAQ